MPDEPYVPSRYARSPWYRSPMYLFYVCCAVAISARHFYVLLNVSYLNSYILLHMPHMWRPWWIFEQLGSIGLDMFDWQWRAFVLNAHLLIGSLCAFVLVSRLVRSQTSKQSGARVSLSPMASISSVDGSVKGPSHHSQTDRSAPGTTYLSCYHAIFGLIFVCVLHGPRVVFMLIAVAINYFVIAPLFKKVPYRWWLLVVWGFHVSMLFLNQAYDGYQFKHVIGPSVGWLDDLPQLTRWHVVFNMSTLRMIAYCIDKEESVQRGTADFRAKLEESHQAKCLECVSRGAACYKLRTDTPRFPHEYNLINYIAYLFYPPLYMAGPMSSFNAYVSHLHIPQRWFNLKDGLIYGIRIVTYIFLLFAMLHYEHILSMRYVTDIYSSAMASGYDMRPAMLMHMLGFLWLKFSIIWKSFRLMALADGIEVPEDMVRCYCSSTTIANFWRDWHASFNLWIVRYMYIPMGGNRYKALSIIPIFLFIAIWHDIEMKLISWALIVCAVFVPETIVTSFVSSKRFDWLRDKPYYLHLRVIGCFVTIAALMASNMVGYSGQVEASPTKVENLTIDIWVHMFLIYLISTLGWRSRDVAYEDERRKRWELGLPIKEADANRRELLASCN